MSGHFKYLNRDFCGMDAVPFSKVVV